MGWGDRSGRIEHGGPALVWEQVRDDLAADIASGDQPVGSRLPSEQALAEVYGVSRPTVRRAIAALVERGMLTVVHGRGTFVIEREQ